MRGLKSRPLILPTVLYCLSKDISRIYFDIPLKRLVGLVSCDYFIEGWKKETGVVPPTVSQLKKLTTAVQVTVFDMFLHWLHLSSLYNCTGLTQH